MLVSWEMFIVGCFCDAGLVGEGSQDTKNVEEWLWISYTGIYPV